MNSKLDENNIHSLFELDKHLYNLKDEQLFEWKLKNSCINSINKLQDTTLFIQSREDPFSQYLIVKIGI
jgi:beta-lactamase class D